jgi:threonine dehydrogenase-like Zn-dependent dehydrogenase
MSRHEPRQKLAADLGATEIITERGDAGVAQVKDRTKRPGRPQRHRGRRPQESMMQAIRATRPGGHVGYVGVSHGVELPGAELSSPPSTCPAYRPRYAASCPSSSN